MARDISSRIKKLVVAKQRFKCNNHPHKTLRNLEGFNCPLWDNDEYYGIFDEKGYEIDHIMEFALTQDNSKENLQALCIVCHREKTNRFMRKLRETSIKVNKIQTCVKIENIGEIHNNVKAREIKKQVPHTCAQCDKLFSTKQRLQYHIKNNVCSSKKHKCKYCANSLDRKSVV